MSYVTGYVDCHCGRKVVLRTSWTEDNPGRRFHSCLEYDEDVDFSVGKTLRYVVGLGNHPRLLKRINNMNEELVKLKFENTELGKLKFENTELVKLKCQNKKLRRLVIIPRKACYHMLEYAIIQGGWGEWG
ncbi:hypothetical protein DH2020_019611 [Rehmannia glutinosa]|uniref:Zinc finger GRF-type domain-containing protein n=1 Tax=Rehmannia glutinosa TaxID=99300 RepID=A0ABR0WR92_REHGL